MFGALAAISDVTLSVRPGERRAVLGSNGAGKTTLFNCITGDFQATSGIIRFFGEDVTRFPAHERIRRGLRRTYQITSLFAGLTVLDNVYLACRGVSRNRFSLLRPRRDDALVHAAETLVAAVRLTEARDGSSPNWPMASSASSRSPSRSPARRASSFSMSRRRACRQRSGAISCRSSRRCPPTSATSSSSTTWMWRCASWKASR